MESKMQCFQLCFTLMLTILSSFIEAAPARLPSSFQLCKSTEKDINSCLMSALTHAIPKTVTGIKSLGVLPIDPLQVSVLDIDQGEGPVSVKLNFRNQLIGGLKDLKIESITANVDPKNYKLVIKGAAPKISLIGDYTIDGKVLVLPITGTGKNELILDDVNANVEIRGHSIQKDGEEYVEITDFKLNLDTRRLHLKLENLFNGDKALGDNMNVFLNENWEPILHELLPSFEAALGTILKEISNRVYLKVPYKYIHPSE